MPARSYEEIDLIASKMKEAGAPDSDVSEYVRLAIKEFEEDKSSAIGAGVRAALVDTPSTAAGLAAGAKVGALTAPLRAIPTIPTQVIGWGAPLVAGAAASMLANAATRKALPKGVQERLEKDYEQQKTATVVGSVGAALPFMGPGTAANTIRQQVLSRGLSGTVGGAAQAADELINSEEGLTPEGVGRIAIAAGGNALFDKPTRLGNKLLGITDKLGNASTANTLPQNTAKSNEIALNPGSVAEAEAAAADAAKARAVAESFYDQQAAAAMGVPPGTRGSPPSPEEVKFRQDQAASPERRARPTKAEREGAFSEEEFAKRELAKELEAIAQDFENRAELAGFQPVEPKPPMEFGDIEPTRQELLSRPSTAAKTIKQALNDRALGAPEQRPPITEREAILRELDSRPGFQRAERKKLGLPPHPDDVEMIKLQDEAELAKTKREVASKPVQAERSAYGGRANDIPTQPGEVVPDFQLKEPMDFGTTPERQIFEPEKKGGVVPGETPALTKPTKTEGIGEPPKPTVRQVELEGGAQGQGLIMNSGIVDANGNPIWVNVRTGRAVEAPVYQGPRPPGGEPPPPMPAKPIPPKSPAPEAPKAPATETTSNGEEMRRLMLEEQKRAGWDPNWPFVPQDLGNRTFVDGLIADQTISEELKKRIINAAKKLGVSVAEPTTPKIPAKKAPEDFRTQKVEFIGDQEDRAGGSFGLYNLTKDITDANGAILHSAGSTVGENTLRKYGIPVPERPAAPKAPEPPVKPVLSQSEPAKAPTPPPAPESPIKGPESTPAKTKSPIEIARDEMASLENQYRALSNIVFNMRSGAEGRISKKAIEIKSRQAEEAKAKWLAKQAEVDAMVGNVNQDNPPVKTPAPTPAPEVSPVKAPLTKAERLAVIKQRVAANKNPVSAPEAAPIKPEAPAPSKPEGNKLYNKFNAEILGEKVSIYRKSDDLLSPWFAKVGDNEINLGPSSRGTIKEKASKAVSDYLYESRAKTANEENLPKRVSVDDEDAIAEAAAQQLIKDVSEASETPSINPNDPNAVVKMANAIGNYDPGSKVRYSIPDHVWNDPEFDKVRFQGLQGQSGIDTDWNVGKAISFQPKRLREDIAVEKINKNQAGFINPQAGATLAGAAIGAATRETPEEKLRNAAIGAGIGAGGTLAARKLAAPKAKVPAAKIAATEPIPPTASSSAKATKWGEAIQSGRSPTSQEIFDKISFDRSENRGVRASDAVVQELSDEIEKVPRHYQPLLTDLVGRFPILDLPGINLVPKGISGMAKLTKRLMGTTLSNIRERDPEAAGKLEEYAHKLSKLQHEWSERGLRFDDIARKNLTPEEYKAFDLATQNGKYDEAMDAIKANPAAKEIEEALQDAFALRREIRQEMLDRGIEVGDVGDALPRHVWDRKGLLEHLGSDAVSAYDDAIRAARKAKGVGRPLTETEEADIFNKIVSRGSITGGGRPGFLKGRVIDEITPEMYPFYERGGVSMKRYIDKAARHILNQEFFGKVSPDYTYNEVLSGSIGDIIAKNKRSGKLLPEDAEKIEKALRAYFHSDSRSWDETAELAAKIRNIQTFGMLTDATTSAMQFADIFGILYRYGIRGGAGYFRTGKDRLSLKDVNVFEGHNQELADISRRSESGSVVSRGIRKAYEWPLRKFLGTADAINKGGLINAAHRYWSDMVHKPGNYDFERISKYYSEMFPDRWPKMLEDLKSPEFKQGKLNDNTAFFLRNELARAQPIGLAQRAQGYAEANNWQKLAYTLRSYAMMQQDILRNDVYNEMKKGRVWEGIKNLAYYAALVGVGQQAFRSGIDMALGKDPETADEYAVQGIMQLALIPRYSIYRLKEQGPFVAGSEWAIPGLPAMMGDVHKDVQTSLSYLGNQRTGKGDLVIPDTESLGKELEFPKYLPVVGKTLYNRFGKGAEKERKRQEQEAAGKTRPGSAQLMHDMLFPPDLKR